MLQLPCSLQTDFANVNQKHLVFDHKECKYVLTPSIKALLMLFYSLLNAKNLFTFYRRFEGVSTTLKELVALVSMTLQEIIIWRSIHLKWLFKQHGFAQVLW